MDIREIARRAKVSTATVSRTINGVPTVDPQLAKRVWKVVNELGYYPNRQARALVSGRSRIFGLIVSEITNPFFPEIVQSFEDLAVQHNFEDLRFRNVPLVFVDVGPRMPGVSNIRVNYQEGIREAVQHLAALRHARIAFVSGPVTLRSALARKAAFEQSMQEIGLNVAPELIIEGDHTMKGGMRALLELLSVRQRPTGVLCSNDMTAIGLMREAFDYGIRVPEDLSVVGFDDIRLAQFMIPPLTTVQMSQTELASLAFKALLNHVESDSSSLNHTEYVLNTTLVVRKSTGLAPSSVVAEKSMKSRRLVSKTAKLSETSSR